MLIDLRVTEIGQGRDLSDKGTCKVIHYTCGNVVVDLLPHRTTIKSVCLFTNGSLCVWDWNLPKASFSLKKSQAAISRCFLLTVGLLPAPFCLNTHSFNFSRSLHHKHTTVLRVSLHHLEQTSIHTEDQSVEIWRQRFHHHHHLSGSQWWWGERGIIAQS